MEPTPDIASEIPHPAHHRHRRQLAAMALVAATAVLVSVGLALRGRVPETPAPPNFTVSGGAVELLASAPQWKYIELAPASRADPLPPAPAPARVAVDETRAAPIYAPLPGRVEQVTVQLGQEVKPGDRLLAIRSSALPELGREVASARAALAVKTAMAERVRDLVKLSAVPEKDLVLAEQERRQSELDLRAAQGKRRSLRLRALDNSGLYWITATKPGTVVERRALVGMEVGPDRAEPLLAISDLSEVIVVADVLERETPSLRVGMTATIVDVALGGTVAGRVEYIAQLVDPVRRTVAVRVRAANPGSALRPNAFAQVTFAASGERRIVVPAEAVVTDDQKSVVFVKRAAAGGATRLERREVQLGRVRDGRAEIFSGLGDGETFVARGALLLLNALDLAG